MAVSFKVTDERIMRGRQPKPIPDYVIEAVELAIVKGTNVEAVVPESEAKDLFSDFNRLRKRDKSLNLTVSQKALGNGKVRFLVSANRVS